MVFLLPLVGEQKHDGDEDEQHGDHAIQRV
jgi:hypothetical protein